ncbi:hypothetical protein Back11_44170 [Paenibacillus baekrokdamisoli]|uniref:Uncharacterized protein n=1 Tax=Paenibacillus baekrokdamisoli TaxID=1712516 RepID=A0A3G9IXL7_9BACL|nr:discoidin domain-containing protein [Paenibacillus baekrokdamisoli]MBB3067881.1 hypothetical protein [Paenibacillus baekrokdamisoli]BBH23072.1 hypothetical protein Back11_44170 [Paenibacillus baekrokdamisoli]
MLLKKMSAMFIAFVLILGSTNYAPGKVHAAYNLWLGVSANPDTVTLINEKQKLEFIKDSNGKYKLKTYIDMGGEKWQPLFDGSRPLAMGPGSDLYPTSFSILNNTGSHIAVLFSGTHSNPAYNFDILVEVNSGSPLIHFKITNHLTSDLQLHGLEPASLFWINGIPNDLIEVHQESPSYESPDDTVQWNNTFPAAYLWTGKKEAGIFYNMASTNWFSTSQNFNRFKDVQVRVKEQDGMIAMGLEPRKQPAGTQYIASGDMVTEFYLYGNYSPQGPASRMAALDKMVNIFSERFPSSTTWPQNVMDPGQLTYEFFGGKAAEQLMLPDVTYKIQPYHEYGTNDGVSNQRDYGVSGTWNDGPVFPERTNSQLVRRADYASYAQEHPNATRDPSFTLLGDWETGNNAMVPWIAYERLHPNLTQRNFINDQLDDLLVYYNPESKLIRSFENSKDYQNQFIEFSWANPTFSINTWIAHKMRDPAEFDPAIGGKYIMGLEGLIELAHHTNYVFPLQWSVQSKLPVKSIDYGTTLGAPTDVWAAGLFAYDMMLAYKATNEQRYLDEAKKAVDGLFEGMTYKMSNPTFTKTYDDPYEFALNEVTNNAYGISASELLYETTGLPKYLAYSNDFKNTTLRLMNWYESGIRGNAADQSMQSQGLFHPFSSAMSPTSWENILTYQNLTTILRNSSNTNIDLLLKMFNVNRQNNFTFYSATWDPAVFGSAITRFVNSGAAYLPIEDYYTSEVQTSHGFMGPSIYMANNPFLAYMLYEAFGDADNRDILAVNLDNLDQPELALSSIERNFIFYNPTGSSQTFNMRFKHLEAGSYSLSITDPSGSMSTSGKTAAQLSAGISHTLASGTYVRVKIETADAIKMSRFEAMQDAQIKLIQAYRKLQESGRDIGVTEQLLAYKADYQTALSQYQNGSYSQSATTVNAFLGLIPQASDPSTPASKKLDDFAETSNWGNKMVNENAVITTDGTIATIKTGSDSTWGFVSKPVYYDLDAYPYLQIQVPDVSYGAAWNILINDNKGFDDVFMMDGNAAAGGKYTFNLKGLTGWSGKKGFTVKIAVVGGNGKHIKVDELIALAQNATATYTPPSQTYSNIAYSKSAAADSVHTAGQEADKALNGNTDLHDMWTSAYGLSPHWLTVDLGQSTTIDRYVIKHAGTREAAVTNTKSFKIQSSDDGSTWTDRDTVTGNADSLTDRNVTPFTARYVRLYITQPHQDPADGHARIYEFELYKPDMSNKALNRTASADSEYSPQLTATKAVNGNVDQGGMWRSAYGHGPHWLSVDLGQSTPIGRYVVKHAGVQEAVSNNTRDFKLQSSDDGIHWTDRDSVWDNTASVTDRSVAPFKARYVRLYITRSHQNPSDGYARIYEFETYVQGNGNLARNKPVQTDSIDVSAPTQYFKRSILLNGGALAVNGDDSNFTYWRSGNGSSTHWLQVDLGQSTEVARYVVKHSGSKETPVQNTSDFKLQSSNDGVNWSDRDTVTGNMANITDRSIVPFTAKYVRLYITKPGQLATDLYARIYEFELYGN